MEMYDFVGYSGKHPNTITSGPVGGQVHRAHRTAHLPPTPAAAFFGGVFLLVHKDAFVSVLAYITKGGADSTACLKS